MDKEILSEELEKMFYKDYGYTPKQMDKVTGFIKEEFGDGNSQESGWIIHEIKSEYVHVDVDVTGNEDFQYFVTFGMGAREMPNYVTYMEEELSRLELNIMLSLEYKLTDRDKLLIASELQKIAKFPFRENTFFAPGHTINVSKEFKKKFGYDYVLFFVPTESLFVEDLGKVHFIPLIPIYEKERDWMAKNNSFDWMRAFFEEHDMDSLCIDNKREEFIPD